MYEPNDYPDAVIKAMFPPDVWADLTREKAEDAAREAAESARQQDGGDRA